MICEDLTGKKFGRFLVAGQVENNLGVKVAFWNVVCECGNARVLRNYVLKSGHTLSCGCAKRDAVISRNTRHGLSELPEYVVWKLMRRRCNSSGATGWGYYGGRGIAVCKEWDDFNTFYADMGSRPSPDHQIDRKDNDKGYCKENCKWSTRGEQMRNYRRNVLVSYGGEILVLKDLSDRLGFNYGKTCYHARSGQLERLIPGAVIVREGNIPEWSEPLKGRPRPSHCKNGHAFDENNTSVGKKARIGAPPFRVCKECHRIREENRRKKLRDSRATV